MPGTRRNRRRKLAGEQGMNQNKNKMKKKKKDPTSLILLPYPALLYSTLIPLPPASVGKETARPCLSQDNLMCLSVRQPRNGAGPDAQKRRRSSSTPHDYDIDGHPDDTLSLPSPKCLPAAFFSAREQRGGEERRRGGEERGGREGGGSLTRGSGSPMHVLFLVSSRLSLRLSERSSVCPPVMVCTLYLHMLEGGRMHRRSGHAPQLHTSFWTG